MNHSGPAVYRMPMRTVFLFFLVLHLSTYAQPGGPDLSFVVVRDGKGRPMKGEYAGNQAMREILRDRPKEPWTVEVHFTVSTNYPYSPAVIGTQQWWPVLGTPLRDKRYEHRQFNIMDCWCTDLYMQVILGDERMRIDLPDAPSDRWMLVQRVMQRSGDRASPEVFRFRPGRFTFAELAQDSMFNALEVRLAQHVKQLAEGSSRK